MQAPRSLSLIAILPSARARSRLDGERMLSMRYTLIVPTVALAAMLGGGEHQSHAAAPSAQTTSPATVFAPHSAELATLSRVTLSVTGMT